ncbi:MAG: hypothetical protein HW402_484 [Dehalococcoidales bacterium]|nr:hypothetical protein [Dehalococcoidales bacterium]
MTTRAGSKPRYFYGWNIVAATFLANLSYVEHLSSVLGLFVKPLQHEFGWSRSALAAVQTIARLVEALVAPLVGPVIDRYGPRVLMPIGAIIVGVAMLGVTQISAIWQFYLLRGIIVALGFTFMGALVTNVAINNWFIRRRGRALAIAHVGVFVSSIIFIPLTVFVIAASGWRVMFVIFAVVTWLVVLIPSALLMRRRPEDMGLSPDGIDSGTIQAVAHPEQASHHGQSSTAEPVWSRREILTTGSFWLLVACFGIDSLALQGINMSLAPYIQDLGYENATLTAVLTFRAVITVVMLPLMGFLAEYANRLYVRVTPFAIQSVAAFLFLFAGGPLFLWVAVAVYSLGSAGLMVTQEVLWANYFGRFSLGSVRSLAFLIGSGFGAAGPVAMNAVFDITGSYRPAFIAIAGLVILAASLMAIVRPPKPRRYATADGIVSSRPS